MTDTTTDIPIYKEPKENPLFTEEELKVLEIKAFENIQRAKYGDWIGDQNTIMRLIHTIRKQREWLRAKDDLIRYCLGPTRDVKTPKLQEALAIGGDEK